ncbi:hypothetical protein [Pandoraea pnomenusa]|uniref:hypothetical protein n=1 Tax=Pandoraea pnomenusa TaxID=93220 RepID=UPI0017480AE8|nr:hypothetical protein [Pandoraea pnomenusa]
MQQFDITVPANKPFVVNAPGRFIKYVSGSNGGGDASLLVTPGLAGGQVMTLVPGQGFRLPSNVPMPSSWTVANKAGGATILGSVVIGDGDFIDATVAGNVNVIDNNRALTLSNQAFLGSLYQAATSGQYLKILMFNPAGSGKNAYVQRLQWDSDISTSAASVFLVNSTAGLTNQGSVPSKLGGGAPGVTQMWAGPTAVAPVQAGSIAVLLPTVSMPETQPICMPPGWGLLCYSTTPGNNGRMTAEIVEQ